MVGLLTGKTIALVNRLPFVAVNHLEAHALTARLTRPARLPLPAAAGLGWALPARGRRGVGRYRLLGTTIDDALGEAFDKVAKMLGLGYPGGPRGRGRGGDGRSGALCPAPPAQGPAGLRLLVLRAQDRGPPSGAGAAGRRRASSRPPPICAPASRQPRPTAWPTGPAGRCGSWSRRGRRAGPWSWPAGWRPTRPCSAHLDGPGAVSAAGGWWCRPRPCAATTPSWWPGPGRAAALGQVDDRRCRPGRAGRWRRWRRPDPGPAPGATGGHRARPRASSSACVPRSTIRPSSRTRISSASTTVESRWAITSVVVPAQTSRRSAWTRRSVALSSDEVASSRMKMRGRLRIGAGDGDALLLAAGELEPALADQGRVAVGQRAR